MKCYYDRGANLNKFKEGDAVRVRRFRLNKGTKKFEDYYEGPFYVVDVLGDVTFRVAEGPRAKRRVLHHDALLPYFNRDPANVVLDNAWVFKESKTYTPAGDCDAAVQTDAWQPPPVSVPDLIGDSASESSDEEAELHADVIDAARAAPSALTDDAGSQPPAQYVLRNRRVPPAPSPPAMLSTSPVQPRRRGRPRRAPPDCRAEAAIQTRIQLDVGRG